MKPAIMRSLPAIFALILLPCARGADVPRYTLTPGRVLVYSLHMENNTEKSAVTYEGRWEFTVLKRNEDGSFHIAAIKAQAQTSTAIWSSTRLKT